MSCTNPIYALRLFTEESGKQHLKILSHEKGKPYSFYCERYGKENILMLPCGRCDSCIEDRSRSWAMRCVLEASQYEANSFITLTYKTVPDTGLVKKDLQLFFKRLRKKFGSGIRYFACGEYGTSLTGTHRPHYHAIIFNWFPPDAKYVADSEYGGYRYSSKILTDLWGHGITEVGEVSYASCGYVARYCQKKLKSKKLTGEFCLMSRRPGIGQQWFNDHYKDIYDTDFVYFQFGNTNKLNPCRYFDKLYEVIDKDDMDRIKNVRISNANASMISDMFHLSQLTVEQYFTYKGTLKKDKFLKLKRGGPKC